MKPAPAAFPYQKTRRIQNRVLSSLDGISPRMGAKSERDKRWKGAYRLYDMGTGNSITANALFNIAEIYGLEPDAHLRTYVSLKPLNSFMNRAFEEWATQYELLRSEKISEADYQLWKDCYAAEYEERDYPERYEFDSQGNPKLTDNWEAYCFSSKLKALRAKHDMTQPDFAILLDIKLGEYHSYEQGWRFPRSLLWNPWRSVSM